MTFKNHRQPFCKMAANATPTSKFKANKWIHVLLDHHYKSHITNRLSIGEGVYSKPIKDYK